MLVTKEYLFEILNEPDKEATAETILEIIESVREAAYDQAIIDMEIYDSIMDGIGNAKNVGQTEFKAINNLTPAITNRLMDAGYGVSETGSGFTITWN